MTDSIAIHCSLTPEEQRIRRRVIRASILPHVTSVASIPDGLRIEFATHKKLRDTLEEFIELEQSCCGFLNFALSPSSDLLCLHIKGPSDAEDVIEIFRLALLEQSQ